MRCTPTTAEASRADDGVHAGARHSARALLRDDELPAGGGERVDRLLNRRKDAAVPVSSSTVKANLRILTACLPWRFRTRARAPARTSY